MIKKPGWQNKKITDRFWGAQGIPRVFLDKLFEYSLAPMRLPRPLEVGFREKAKSVECWNLFLDRGGAFPQTC